MQSPICEVWRGSRPKQHCRSLSAALLILAAPATLLGGEAARLELRFDEIPPEPLQTRVTVTASLLPDAPLIDGDLSDKVWQKATRISLAHNCGDGAPPPEETNAFLGHRADKLYIAVRSPAKELERPTFAAKHVRDRPVWHDDCIEMLFDVDHDHETFDAIIVNSAGAVADFRQSQKRDMGWNANIRAATRIENGSWSLEIAIGKESFEERDNAIWGFNLVRRLAGMSGCFSWNPVKGDPREASKFGHLSFEQSPIYIRHASFGTLREGENLAVVTVVNQSKEPIELEGILAVAAPGSEPRKTHYKVHLPAKHAEVLGFPFNVAKAGPRDIALGLLDPETREIRAGLVRKRIQAVKALTLEPIQRAESGLAMGATLALTPHELQEMRLTAALRQKAGAETLASVSADKIVSHRATIKLIVEDLPPGEYEMRVTLAARDRVVDTARHTFTWPIPPNQ